MPKKQAVADILWAYRKKLGDRNGPLPLRAMSRALNIILTPIGGHISHQTLSNWENQVHTPSGQTIMQLMQLADHEFKDWRKDLAIDLLSILKSERYRPASPIGARVFQRMQRRYAKPASLPPR